MEEPGRVEKTPTLGVSIRLNKIGSNFIVVANKSKEDSALNHNLVSDVQNPKTSKSNNGNRVDRVTSSKESLYQLLKEAKEFKVDVMEQLVQLDETRLKNQLASPILECGNTGEEDMPSTLKVAYGLVEDDLAIDLEEGEVKTTSIPHLDQDMEGIVVAMGEGKQGTHPVERGVDSNEASLEGMFRIFFLALKGQNQTVPKSLREEVENLSLAFIMKQGRQ
ncbi:hypothetical protein SUGI_0514490 [Cryptomeria japonica]|nr:hypothetical protein SUGI_0514490 [Cryptomeria japonica]